MEFCIFLKKLRIKLKYTQSDMVNHLVSIDPIFETLNLVSYGRWERGNAQPSTKKMLLIVISVGYNVEDFIRIVDFKLSKGNVDKFSDWINFNIELGVSSSILGYCSSILDRYRIKRFNKRKSMFDTLSPYLLDKVYRYEIKSMGLPLDTNIDIDIRRQWQKNGNLKHLLYLTSSNDLHAHMSWSLHPIAVLSNFVKDFQENRVDTILKNEPKDSGLLFMYIHLAIPYDKKWTNFILKEIVTFLLKKTNVVKVVFNSNIKEQAFKTLDLFNGDILLTSLNVNYKEPQLNRLISIESIDILSNHGVIDAIKRKNIIKSECESKYKLV